MGGLRSIRWVLGLILVAWIAATPLPARADSAGKEVGLGVSVALINLLYGPIKSIYAGGGALVGGAAWLFSGGDADVSGPILDASLRGDYAVTREHLEGKRSLAFIGRNPAQRRLDATGY
jgi:hypothetical protein